MFTSHSNLKKFLTTVCFVAILFSASGLPMIIPAKTAEAVGKDVPIGTDFDFNHIMGHLKDFVLNQLVYALAKRMLHELTYSVVNWINNGFEGSPSFLQDPAGFFLDVADQVVGEYIASTGALANVLCSPFNFDLRLNLSLAQSSFTHRRYACTLKTVINNARNARVSVGVTVGTSPNGMTIGDIVSGNIANNPNAINVNGASIDETGAFMGGNFSKGGWAGFLALTTEPQNNLYGATLMARSDMQKQMSAKKRSINNDLNRGNGFLSWKDCKPIGSAREEDYYAMQELKTKTQGDTTVSQKRNKDGTVTFQTCQTQTPGSVVSGKLLSSLNNSDLELALADDINAIINALMGQLIGAIMKQGLGSMSASAGGGAASATAELKAQEMQIYEEQIGQSRTQAAGTLTRAEAFVEQNVKTYSLAVTALENSYGHYTAAQACFKNKVNTLASSVTFDQARYADDAIKAMQTTTDTKLSPLVNTLVRERELAQARLDEVRDMQYSTSQKINTTQDIQNQQSRYQNAAQKASDYNSEAQAKQVKADADLLDAQKQAQAFDADAARYQAACDAFPNITPLTTTPAPIP